MAHCLNKFQVDLGVVGIACESLGQASNLPDFTVEHADERLIGDPKRGKQSDILSVQCSLVVDCRL